MSEAPTWDRLASRYDLASRIFGRSYPAVRRALTRDLAGRERALELASGTGQFTLTIADAVQAVVATDVSIEMVERLRSVVVAHGAEQVSVRRMSAYDIDADDQTFDAIVCANALHVMERPREALAEMHRVVATDGLVIAPTFLHGASRATRTLSRLLSAASPFVAHTRFDMAKLVGLFRTSGFQVVHTETFPGLFHIGYVVARRPS
ncbi:MAG: methyltransferase domain-containing protein [Sandaracinus sp.]|nr:methyltransferase domain-containing protein [Sandaracinus sp.]